MNNFYGNNKGKQLKVIQWRKMKELQAQFDLPTKSGIYVFSRDVLEGEKDSEGNLKTGKKEAYIGQSKNIVERCAKHFMPFCHNHLAISLKKHKDGKISYSCYSLEQLDEVEKDTIKMYCEDNLTKLFNNSSGGQAKARGKNLEDSDFKKAVEHKKSSVEGRALNKVQAYKKSILAFRKYFDVKSGMYNIVIEPKDSAFTKKKRLKNQAINQKIKLEKLLGE